MASSRMPPAVIQKWAKIKNEMPSILQQNKNIPAEYKADIKKQIETLFRTFDGGLKDKMKTASTAKNDADAKKAMQEVVTVTTDYLKKVAEFRRKFGVAGSNIAEAVEKALNDIHEAAESSLKAMN